VTAWRLHQAWPGSVLRMIDAAGHAGFEPGIASALMQATDEFRDSGRFAG
jgi:proline iminopeptidase